MNWQQVLAAWLPVVPAFLLSVCVHESAHALAALKLGDDTAAKQGRISLYPPRHLELIGSLVVPLFSVLVLGVLFGYAKPTPVDPGKMRHPKAGYSLSALAGPLSNLLLALLGAGLGRLALGVEAAAPLIPLLQALVWVNVTLGLLNLLPMPGFDGIKALYVLLPDSWCWRLNRAERWGIAYLALLSALGGLAWMAAAVTFCLGWLSRLSGFPA